MSDPYLSVVITTRNDDHGGQLLKRMQICINNFIEQCRINDLDAELIIVEWNPPLDRPKLKEVLSWPKKKGPCSVRIIEVPPHLHATYANSDRLRLFQMIAKNVGIRRARGEFVLATNCDILFSPELIHFFTQKKLVDNKMYRVDRYDVNPDIPIESSAADQIRFCMQNVTRINTKNGTFTQENMSDSKKLIWKITQTGISTWRTVKKIMKPKKDGCQYPLHTHACGDFTLMTKRDWLKIRGYPEFPVCSMHIDTLLCYMAHYSGFSEVILPPPNLVYHIDHESGWSTEKEKRRVFTENLIKKGIPSLELSQVLEWICFMQKSNKPIIFNNGDSWGLGEIPLPEEQVYHS